MKDPKRILTIYVLPSLHKSITIHPKIMNPRNQYERMLMFAGYCMRKWRFAVSDFFARPWHAFGKWTYDENSKLKSLYSGMNVLTTRKCVDEYFLKNIAFDSKEVQIIYPTYLNELLIKQQLRSWLSDSPTRFKMSAFKWAISTPLLFILAKLIFVPANILLSYTLFRSVSSFRAWKGSDVLQRLVNDRKILWIPSEKYTQLIRDKAKEVEQELSQEGLCWKFAEDETDLHDDVVTKLEIELRAPELIRSHRRNRMQMMFRQLENVP